MGNKNISYVIILIILALLFGSCSNDNETAPQVDRISVGTMNVDGLPVSVPLGWLGQMVKKILPDVLPVPIDADGNLIVNAGGPGENGSKLIGQKIKAKDWDVFGLNEDFNYHNEIWSSLDGYSRGKYMGKFDASQIEEVIGKVLLKQPLFEIDGLEFGARTKYQVCDETIRKWVPEAIFGYFTDSQDSLTTKGFRYYQVKLDEQASVDFIILHADAGNSEGAVRAREAAFNQMYEFIVNEIKTNNPLIVMGDFNSLYVRDRMEELFLKRLNDSGIFDAHDVWVEYYNNGVFPECKNTHDDDSSLPVTKDCEMIDKIVYANRKNNANITLKLESAANVLDFVYDDDKTKQLADHYPMEASFLINRK